MNCSRCQLALYCSKDCQKEDWKNGHKRICGKTPKDAMAEELDATLNMFGASSPSTSVAGMNISQLSSRPGKAPKFIRDAAYLNSLSESDAMLRIIDSYRLRVEDEYTFEGEAGGLYGGDDPVPDFKDFLIKAEKKGGILPSWWSLEKRQECIRLGRRRNHFNSLYFAVEKSDIIEHYKDNWMPMKLRMIAQMVTGSKIGM